ncbi:MAG: 6-pyruvoyl trahydropterin synthase family protein [Halorhodospira sp.]
MTGLLYTAEMPFEAARRDARGWHGHSFRLRVRAAPAEGARGAMALAQAAGEAVAPLDYSLLNEHLPAVDDRGLLKALGQRLQDRGIAPRRLALRSAPDRGAAWGEDGWSWRTFCFEAAHRLPHVPQGHPCGRMHGHGYRVTLESTGLDAQQLGALWAPVGAEIDHACLNDFLPNPTSELIAAWLWQRLEAAANGIRRIHVHETEHSGCVYDGSHHTIWKAQRFEAATRVAGASDRRDRLHGHGYRLRVHVTTPLDQDLGWTLDYADVKRAFAPVREALDHQRLDTLEGLEGGDVATLARWLVAETAPRLPQLSRIDVFERKGVGAIAYPE